MKDLISERDLLNEDIGFVTGFVNKTGPEPSEYDLFLKRTVSIAKRFKAKTYGKTELKLLSEAFGESLSLRTLQGQIFRKPHGYNGDYEVMEKVYLNKICPNPKLARWDRLWQSQNGSKALRNRKTYFKQLLEDKLNQHNGTLHVLDIASGSCRDLFEFIQKFPKADIKIDCIDIDKNSILYAKSLNSKYINKIRFYYSSSFKFMPTKKYDLIWSGGLLDYFNDKNFVFSLRKWLGWLNESGHICIGNYSDKNVMKDFMYILDWKLFYRTKFQLLDLSKEITKDMNIEVYTDSEPEEVNHFLHLKKQIT